MKLRPAPEAFITVTSKEPDGSERIIRGRVGQVEIEQNSVFEDVLLESGMYSARPYQTATDYTLKATFLPNAKTGDAMTVTIKEKSEYDELPQYSKGFLDGYAAALDRARKEK